MGTTAKASSRHDVDPGRAFGTGSTTGKAPELLEHPGAAAWARLPVRIVSTANVREHWSTKRRREEIAGRAIVPALRVALRRSPQPLPVVVTFTRIGPRALDKHDNLRHAFKFVADLVAKMLEVDDADPRISFRYDQRKALPDDEVVRGYGLVVQIERLVTTRSSVRGLTVFT